MIVRPPTPFDKDPRFENRLPRIFVGIVAFGDIPHQAFDSFMQWWGQSCARYKGRFELYYKTSPRKEQYRARNALVLQAETAGADVLLMIDDDQLVHVEPDMLGKFADFGANIMGGLYYQRGGLYHPVVMHEDNGAMGRSHYRFFHPRELPAYDAPPLKVDTAGHGCMWVDMSVYARMRQPHHWPYPSEAVFVPDERFGLDVNFCHRARHEQGEDVYLMPNIRIGHLANERIEVYDSNRPPQEMIDKTEEAAMYWSRVNGRRIRQENQDGSQAPS